MKPETLVLGTMIALGILCLICIIAGKVLKALGDDNSICPDCNDEDAGCPVCRNPEGL